MKILKNIDKIKDIVNKKGLEIYEKISTPTVLISSGIGGLYSILFQLFYLKKKLIEDVDFDLFFLDSFTIPFLNPEIWIYMIVGILLSIILSIKFPKVKDTKFYITVFKYILIGIILGFISELITDYLVFFGAFIGLYFSTRKKTNANEFSFKKYAWKQFKKNKIALVSLYILFLLIFIALFAPYLANDAPLSIKYNGETIYPAYQIEKYNRTIEISPATKNKIKKEVEKLKLNEEDEKEEIKKREDQAKKSLMPKLIHPETKDSVSYTSINWKLWEEKEWIENVIYAPITYSPQSQNFINSDYKDPWKYGTYKNLTKKLNTSIENGESEKTISKIKDEIKDVQKHINHKGDTVDISNRHRHVLGTGPNGRDLASGLIHATRISLSIGIISMGIAALIGIILGALSGFFGDDRLKMRRIKYYFTLLGIFFGLYYGYGSRKYIISQGFSNPEISAFKEIMISFGVVILIIIIFRLISRIITNKWLNKEVSVPVDAFVSRGIELLNSIPRLLLIITVSAVMKERSLFIIMAIIGLTSWTGIARFTRAELLRIRNLEYIQASSALGFSSIRTIFKHALPNALAPVFVSIAFGIASAILIESSLSFLNIGVPTEQVTWGSLLNLGRQNTEAWWLIIFPGIAIFLTITVYNMIAEASRDALDPKLKS